MILHSLGDLCKSVSVSVSTVVKGGPIVLRTRSPVALFFIHMIAIFCGRNGKKMGRWIPVPRHVPRRSR